MVHRGEGEWGGKKEKTAGEEKNVTLGGHTEGNVKIVLEFWTQNSQYFSALFAAL